VRPSASSACADQELDLRPGVNRVWAGPRPGSGGIPGRPRKSWRRIRAGFREERAQAAGEQGVDVDLADLAAAFPVMELAAAEQIQGAVVLSLRDEQDDQAGEGVVAGADDFHALFEAGEARGGFDAAASQSRSSS
jgi:hypothetical protein